MDRLLHVGEESTDVRILRRTFVAETEDVESSVTKLCVDISRRDLTQRIDQRKDAVYLHRCLHQLSVISESIGAYQARESY